MTTRTRRIAVVSDAVHPFNKGGKETRIHELTTRLAASGFDVHVYTMKWWPGDTRTYRHDGVTMHAIMPLAPLYAGERRSIGQAVRFGLASFKLMFARFDVIEADHMPFFPLFALKVVSLVRRRPLVATWHEVWGYPYWRTYLGRGAGLAYAVEWLAVRMPNRIVAVSPMTAERLGMMLGYRGPLDIVHNGVDIARISAVRRARTRHDVVFAGRLLTHKNVDRLVRAIGLMAASDPTVSCLIIGDGPELPRLKRLVARLGLGDNVTFTGFIERDDDVYAHLKAGRVFVLPSVREGFGITLIEAMACGMRVITSDHANNAGRHLVTPELGTVCAPTASRLAAAITCELARAGAGAARRTRTAAISYDWTTGARALGEVYA